ncbi:hypothetical protein Hanom_Chr06g00551461 [Helianthus anomalus]
MELDASLFRFINSVHPGTRHPLSTRNLVPSARLTVHATSVMVELCGYRYHN